MGKCLLLMMSSYDSPSCVHIMVLIKTVSKILDRIMTVRLAILARVKGLLNPNECGSIPSLRTFDAYATLFHEIRTLQRSKFTVFTLFLNIKACFGNVDNYTWRSSLLTKNISSNIVDWVSSVPSERTCTLVFERSPNIAAPVLVGTP